MHRLGRRGEAPAGCGPIFIEAGGPAREDGIRAAFMPPIRLSTKTGECIMSDYVRNLWYMAAWVGEVPDDGVLARTFLDEKWLIYRLSTGEYAMLRDRCAHRFVQLSRGERHGDIIHCPYHGLGFNARCPSAGQRRHNAHCRAP
jgi:Rieske [2Fe-2S] domain